jgi:sulfatase modifying factor 1
MLFRLGTVALMLTVCALANAQGKKTLANSLGMAMVRIEPGSFVMGQAEGGDWDERPAHAVTISKSFYMAATPVTNVQYEQFDRAHKALRGKDGFSEKGDEAVLFVSWDEAVAFCEWLSKKEGKPYRLPTEAEWEYACRAGTTTPYFMGDELPDEYASYAPKKEKRDGARKDLRVGQTPPNAWSLRDMHGAVEEWCMDWYGPYGSKEQTDPVGPKEGDFRIARGGSHSTEDQYLRSANRMGTLPKDKSQLIGFRVVMGAAPKSKSTRGARSARWERDVAQTACDWSGAPDPDVPYFEGPIRYVKIPAKSNGPMFSEHNHDPGLAYCANGDLLAIWYSCNTEGGRELCILASRLRRGAKEWEPASPFWDAPDRNDHAPALWHDEKGTLYHFNGLSRGRAYRENLALIMRASKDNGATWSDARLINTERGVAVNQPVTTVIRTSDGRIVLPADAPRRIKGGATALWMSGDEGDTWSVTEGSLLGIHAGVTQLTDGRLFGLGRFKTTVKHASVSGTRMPQSISEDMGKTWTYSDAELPPISGGQRLVLRRLREGPLLLASFTDFRPAALKGATAQGMLIKDASGKKRRVYGLYTAVSFDEGKTWPIKKLITAGGPAKELDGGAHTGAFTMDATHAEPAGYLAATQTPDGVIHLISSAQHYRFNLAWLKQPAPTDRKRDKGNSSSIATGTFRSPLLKRNLSFRVLAPEKAQEGPMPLIVYLKNLGAPRLGTVPDSELISSFLKQDMLVVEVDYQDSAKAKGAEMYTDVLHLYRVFGANHDIDSNKPSFGPLMDEFIKWDEKRITTYQKFVTKRDNREIVYSINPLWVYVIPEGYTIDRDVDVMTIQTDARAMSHRMDIIHPAAPEKPVPAVLEISTSIQTEDPARHTRINRNSCYVFTWTMAGYAGVILDNVANRATSLSIYGEPMTVPMGPNFPEKRALRLLRARRIDWGLSGKVAIMGISKSCLRAIMGALVNDEPPPNEKYVTEANKGPHGDQSDRFDAMIAGGFPWPKDRWPSLMDYLSADDPPLIWCQSTYLSRMARPHYVDQVREKEIFLRKEIGKKSEALGIPYEVFYGTPIGHDFDYVYLRHILSFVEPYMKYRP